jgi:hypothetical protein
VGAGWFATIEEAAATAVVVNPGVDPTGLAATYREAHDRFRQLYPALAPTFHQTT